MADFVCPKCGSPAKKRFFGGSTQSALACLILGGIITYEGLSGPNPDVLFILFLGGLFGLGAVSALTMKKLRCTKCKTVFNPQ